MKLRFDFKKAREGINLGASTGGFALTVATFAGLPAAPAVLLSLAAAALMLSVHGLQIEKRAPTSHLATRRVSAATWKPA